MAMTECKVTEIFFFTNQFTQFFSPRSLNTPRNETKHQAKAHQYRGHHSHDPVVLKLPH